MAHTFSLILVLATFITGIIWAVDKFILEPKRKQKIREAAANANGQVDAETLKKVAPQPGWIESARSMFPVIALILIFRSFLYEPFQIPSGSMMPTLLPGDFILVNKFDFGLRNPITNQKFLSIGEPKVGDVIVFRYPPNPSIDYIKRVVGVPGDTIIYGPDKQICVQKPGQSSCTPVPLTNMRESKFTQNGTRLLEFTEHLGKVTHNILINPSRHDDTMLYYPHPGVDKWVVPKGEYFVMGDNRDNSADSRYWGFVPQANLVGKAVAIWISFEFDRSKDSILPSWIPTGIRFDRIGSIK